jgi:RNA polymerase sigma-70 factor (ECF subfamily)
LIERRASVPHPCYYAKLLPELPHQFWSHPASAAAMTIANAGPDRFRTTHWSLIVAAQGRGSTEARAALAELCEAYWYPLYAFIRRQGHSMEDARDLTQEFFARLLEKDYLGAVDREKGKFRSFLLACCKHFLANEHDRANALKRGGGVAIRLLDCQTAESRYSEEPAHDMTAEKLFERRWALTLLQNVFARLRQEHEQAGKLKLFEQLKPFLAGEGPAARYAEVAMSLRLSSGAVKVAVHRLRRRYRELVHEEIARTVDDPALVDVEIRDLFAALES